MAMQLKKILISDAVDESCRTILEKAGMAVDYRPGVSKEELLASIKVYAPSYPAGISFRCYLVMLPRAGEGEWVAGSCCGRWASKPL